MKERRKLKDINAQMDEISKRRPTKEQIEELGKVIKRISEIDKAVPIKHCNIVELGN